jgi:hypothetical protein
VVTHIAASTPKRSPSSRQRRERRAQRVV